MKSNFLLFIFAVIMMSSVSVIAQDKKVEKPTASANLAKPTSITPGNSTSVDDNNNDEEDDDPEDVELIEPAAPQLGALPPKANRPPAVPTAPRGEQGGPADQDTSLKSGEEFSGTQSKVGKDLSSN